MLDTKCRNDLLQFVINVQPHLQMTQQDASKNSLNDLQSEACSLPGSDGEHVLQTQFGTSKRAEKFYSNQVLDHLNEEMRRFIDRMEIMFVSTADKHGECDCTIRCGLPGFIIPLDQHTVIYPEYRGNGVMASLGNISENPHIGLLLVDFFSSTIGLHINGTAEIIENDVLLESDSVPGDVRVAMEASGGRKPERWVRVRVEEAYIHCSKHIPMLKRMSKEISWGTDDESLKGGDFFGVKRNSR